jgi:acyl carrier protein
MTRDQIKDAVRAYIAQQFLAGESPDNITDDTELVTTGVLDSLASLNLVSWLEEKFAVNIEAHEVDVDHLNTLDLITDMVLAKQSA